MKFTNGVHRLIHNEGFILLPLKGKRPLIKWKAYNRFHPGHQMILRMILHPDADGIGVLTGKHSGVMVLDIDDPKQFLDNNDYYTETPSGGRHYYYRYHEGDSHTLNVVPGVDIPYIAKLYDIPQINNKRIPIQKVQHHYPTTTSSKPFIPDIHPPTMEDINLCLFIQYYLNKRDTEWDGRYPLARAYYSNVMTLADGDTRLGIEYRHQEDIENRPSKPQRCSTIANSGYVCPNMREDGTCGISGAVSPYGLAIIRQRRRLHNG